MTFEPPIRHQRLKLSPDRIAKRIDTLIESSSIVEESIRDLISEVQLVDQILEKCQYAVSLSRRQSACLERAKRSAEELNDSRQG